MKKISKLLSIVLCIAMLMGLAVAASAAETTLDGTYIIADYKADGTQVGGKTASESKSYGYLYDDYTVEEQHERTQYTITHVSDGKYTIVDCYGRYLGVDGTYKRFQIYTENKGDNCLWTITDGTDGEYVVKNVSNGRMIDYSESYSSFGVYLQDELPEDGQVCLVSLNAEEPEVTVNYYVAGQQALCGSDWSKDDAANIMTKGEDGLYTKVYENVAAGSYELKVTDGTWDNCWGGPEGNYKLTVDVLSTVTVIFDAETRTVSTKVEVVEVAAPIVIESGEYVIYAPAYNMALSSVYADGSFYNSGVEVSMTEGVLSGYGETEIWTVTCDEDGNVTLSVGDENLGMQDSYSSMSFGAVNDVWVLEDAGDGLYYVKNVVRECYIEWYATNNNWSGFKYINEGSEGVFALSFVAVNEENPDVPGENPDEPGETPDVPGENPDEPGETPDVPGDDEQEVVPSPYYVAGEEGLCGSNWDEDDSANNMILGEDGLYYIVYKDVAAGTYKFKVTDGTWDNCWGDPENEDMNNYVITIEKAGDVTILFNAETKAITVKVGGEEIPKTGDMSVAALVVAMMTATAGAVVIGKKKF